MYNHSAASSSRTSGNIKWSIEEPKTHWSLFHVDADDDDDEVAEIKNREFFKALQMHPTFGTFFVTFGEGEDDLGLLEVGEKFAEGAQAPLFNIRVCQMCLQRAYS